MRPARPLRLGLVCPYDLDVPGGVREQVLGLARALASGGTGAAGGAAVQVQVLAPRRRGAPSLQVVDGVPVVAAGPAVALPTNGSTARLGLDPVSRARAARWARSGFDVVHVHEPIPPGIGHSVLRELARSRAAGLPGPAVLATVHVSMSPRPAGRSRSLRTAAGHVGHLLRGVDVLTAVSEHARHTLVDHLGRVPVVVPNGVDVASWPWPAPVRPAAAPPTVVVVGRSGEPRKGVDVLLRAWPRVREQRPGARLLVVGPSQELHSAPARGVHLLGVLDEAGKRAAVAGADVLVAPHRGGESFGIVLVEALAAGTRVVASDLPAFRAVLGGLGDLVPPGEPVPLAEALVRALRPGAPDDATAGRRRAEEFDWTRVAERWRELYGTALRVRRHGGAPQQELAEQLRDRARVAAALAAGGTPEADPGPWRRVLQRRARAAADPDDHVAQSALTALLRGPDLPGAEREALRAATARVRETRALVNDLLLRDGRATVELDDDPGPEPAPADRGRTGPWASSDTTSDPA